MPKMPKVTKMPKVKVFRLLLRNRNLAIRFVGLPVVRLNYQLRLHRTRVAGLTGSTG